MSYENYRANLLEVDEITEVETFKKFDGEKLQYHLIPPSTLKGLAQVLTYGANKYSAENWRTVDDKNRYVSALYRHLELWREGEVLDSESGLPHLSHALTNVAFLLELEK